MYLRAKIEADPSWRSWLMNFAVVKVDRCALVASLRASDPRKYDELLADISEVFGRQKEENVSPAGKEAVVEVLRRRFFTPESTRDTGVNEIPVVAQDYCFTSWSLRVVGESQFPDKAIFAR